MGFAWLWLKEVTKAAGVPTAEVFRNVAGLIAGVIVHDQDLPLDRLGKSEHGKAVQHFRQAPATVIGTQNNSDLHCPCRCFSVCHHNSQKSLQSCLRPPGVGCNSGLNHDFPSTVYCCFSANHGRMWNPCVRLHASATFRRCLWDSGQHRTALPGLLGPNECG